MAVLLLGWLTALSLGRPAATAALGDLARTDTGDVFTLIREGECGAAQCAEHGAGAAPRPPGAQCSCACPQRAPLFREDRELCVDDLPECSLATFGTGVGVQRIPFVYLPLKGQIIHPSREITFYNVKTPICAVSGAQFLTRKGFVDLRNTLDADVPFSLFRDEGRTFLQWSGEDELRSRMSGRVLVVRLLCRDVSATPASPLDLRGVFTPCVAFRVQGTPIRSPINITEVQFAPNAQTAGTVVTSGLTVTEYVVIGISSLLLGLIYVASVFLYLHIRKRRKAASEENNARKLKSIKSKDGKIITERDIVRINNERIQKLPNVLGQDDGVIKKNPLLSRQYHDSKGGFPSDSGSNVSDSDDFAGSSSRSEENVCKKKTTSAVVHLQSREMRHQNDTDVAHRDESGIEKLPDEHVSIVETIEDREITRPVGTTRRKLYFNPAYFEPHLMAEPPPAALEFLTKIREVISIAKHKMAAKRFHPVLNEIPEEETYNSGNSLDLYHGLGSQRSGSILSLKRENSRKKSVNCVGCPGCTTDTDPKNHMKTDVIKCTGCLNTKGDKQISIRKWLENIPNGKQQIMYNDISPDVSQNLSESLLSLPNIGNRCRLKKQGSFSSCNSMYSSDHVHASNRSSTRSVRSEPSLRNYNIPLPDFDNVECDHNFNQCPTNEIGDDIAFNDYRSGSSRSYKTLQRRNKILNNKNSLPDMVNEAIALEHCVKSENTSSSDEEKFMTRSLNIDGQSTFTRNKSDSPNGNDYETDSLERTTNKKRILTPTDYPEVSSSQASPSLSNALPLEEELTMRNAVYKTNSCSSSNTPSPQRDICTDQNHYEIIEKIPTTSPNPIEVKNSTKEKSDYSLVSEVYVNNNYNFGSTPTTPSGSDCSMGSRKFTHIEDGEEKPGCLTIEVKDPPENYIKIHESDGFEPDTLDRKHPKNKDFIPNIQFSRKDLVETIENIEKQPQRIQLRSSGTFKKTSNQVEYTAKFNSLRKEPEQNCQATSDTRTKPIEDTDDTWDDSGWNAEEGRILTLEYRHSKRQRQCTPPTIKQLKNLARPDILPPLPPTEGTSLYEQPIIPARRVEYDRTAEGTYSKNSKTRSLSPKQTTSLAEPNSCVRGDLKNGPSCSPVRASVQSTSECGQYDHMPSTATATLSLPKTSVSCRNSNRRIGRNCCSGTIDTSTFVRGKEDGHSRTKYRRKKGSNIDDSGYLSSDSTSSRQIQRKLVIAKIVNGSDTDDTENEARSESGAESTETHSVYFGSFRKLPSSDENSNSSQTFRNSLRDVKR
ncbi:uncharacterized protein LOC106716814 [Papilio machaon]|uniref:uncharacterized protein LOC106716814 n=1 Tax=Papilio machaon TaxID=76193 RepID=UPI001E665BAF|nr:uncharacterized protein LOC106716814 [Papilio machaon]